ncbi:alpha/beta hydrolase [Sinisalibacter aestuarii]|uniref:Hydrolase n=1 Tax=Sinisalibacter aestuarii TaxID=2949426 RepID=A0ABQ5LXL5_9RHOB|nr:alpha/beta hydrolase [Sinisalibacter aestuarii]GKY89358.1 hydrolase [Sinisalibacter aestuarii]
MSRRLRLLLWLSRRFARRQIARVPDPLPLRPMFDRLARRLFRVPPYTLVGEAALAPGLPALIVSNRPGTHPVRPRKAVLYLHGGAFVAGHPSAFVAMLARIARLTRCEVFVPDYRLAPEHPFPAAVEDARTAWDGLIARGYRPGDIVIGGDSAGGNLALGLLAALLDDRIRPAGLFAFSPVTDLTFSGATIATNAARDAVLPAARRDDLMGFYLQGARADDPRASPLLADFPDPPPVFLQYAATEILADDSRRMAAKLRAPGGEVVLDEWPDAPHVWVLFDGILPEARQALIRVAGFVNTLFDEDQAGASAPATR